MVPFLTPTTTLEHSFTIPLTNDSNSDIIDCPARHWNEIERQIWIDLDISYFQIYLLTSEKKKREWISHICLTKTIVSYPTSWSGLTGLSSHLKCKTNNLNQTSHRMIYSSQSTFYVMYQFRLCNGSDTSVFSNNLLF